MLRAFASFLAVLFFAHGALAQAPATAPAETPAPAAEVPAGPAEEPSLEERRLVAYIATGVSVIALATGATFGVLAQIEFDCAKDVIACNQDLNNKIVGEELFDVRAEIEQKALAADMAYLFAGAAAVVATVGYLRGFVFVEEDGATASLPAEPAPVRVVGVMP
jgi:hypothetical protein